jgi:hypothetical protein
MRTSLEVGCVSVQNAVGNDDASETAGTPEPGLRGRVK